MVENLRLYINDKLVEFSTDPKVLYTYQESEVTNPTAVKNSFSKTVTIDGTPDNNDLFGHYWNLERYLLNGGEGGAYFNSSKKAPFQLFIGSDLYEEGYCKLDSIKRVGSDIKYNITLYGGLGDFFFNLSTSENGDEMKLSDLDYTEEGGVDEFNFTSNIDTVKDAWDALRDGTPGKWQYINFMPAYNGYPSDFDADKVTINLNGTGLASSARDGDTWYGSKGGWTIGTLPQEMTEWEIRDLRSYLQRPCIRMKEIVNACCNPDNNGGYTVNLDPDFFHSDNPYWEKTWLSLPMVQNLEYSNEEQILEGAELVVSTTSGDTNGLMYQDMHFDLGEINGNISNVTVRATLKTNSYFGCSSFIWFWNWNGNSYHTNWGCLGSLFCQLIALNGDTVVGASNAYNLTTPIRHNGNLYFGHNGHYPESTDYDRETGRRKMGNGTQFIPYMDMPIYNVLGKFSSSGFCREVSYTSSASTYDTDPYEFTFSINNIGTNITGLKMVYYWGASDDKMKKYGPNYFFSAPHDDGWVTQDIASNMQQLTGTSLDIKSHNLSAVIGESLGRTGTKVTKQLLLNTESTPCDYLLSYCKMFGLHFTKDIGSKTINIMTRKTFYQRDTVVDLEDYIDHGKDIEITPIMFKSKWYEFKQEKDETELSKKYMTAKGVDYGCKVLDTGYQFNSDKINLLDDNCIKSGIEALEKSKWYTAYNSDARLRPWMRVGLKYTLWNGTDEFEYDAGTGNSGSILPINEAQGMKYYDIVPKLQFHGDGNSSTEGNNCLVFFSGFKSVTTGRTNPLTYILSDDTMYQTELNDGTPCWLFTTQEIVGTKRLCYKLDDIPVFERYLTTVNSGTITKSLDFGSAQELYIPNYTLTDDTNIYFNFWREYLTDLFDVNTKMMSCYVKIDTNPGVDWLRRFYWFDNAVWMVNKISDWNPTSYETTKVEFIKVQDIDNYTSVTQVPSKSISLSADTYTVDFTGGTVSIRVIVEEGVSWRLGVAGGASVTMSATAGTGPTTVTATFATNPEEYQVGAYFRAFRNDNGADVEIYVHQWNQGYKSVSVQPEDIIVPWTGGSGITVTFNWINQGDSYIAEVDYDESESALDFAVDYSTYRDENKAVFTIGENTGDTKLHNYCTFYNEEHAVYCSVGLDSLPEGYDMDATGGTFSMDFQYTSTVGFDVPYWITVVDNGNKNYEFVVAPNGTSEPRSAEVIVDVGAMRASFNVRQESDAYFRVQRIDGSGSIVNTGDTATLHVDASTSWTVTTTADFVTLSKSASTQTDDLTVEFTDNTGSESRQATLVFTNADGDVINYTITQDGVGYVPPTPGYVFDVTRVNGSGNVLASGGTVYLSVTATYPWTASTSDVYITVTPTADTSSSTVNVVFQANTGQTRQASITFVDQSGTTITYTQTQMGVDTPVVTGDSVSPSILMFDATSGTSAVTVSISDNWQAVSYPSWVVVSPSSGTSGTTSVDITAIPYSQSDTRTGSVIFVNLTNSEPFIVTCIQTGVAPGEEILGVSPSSLRFTSSGGTTQLTIIANTDWTIG